MSKIPGTLIYDIKCSGRIIFIMTGSNYLIIPIFISHFKISPANKIK